MRPIDLLKRFALDQSGGVAIEYSLIGALIAIGTIAAFASTGGGITAIFDSFSNPTNGEYAKASGSL